MMKVCDTADWFAPELIVTLTTELHESLRFHRKQWEFAMKFNLLREAGVLHRNSSGISFGTGKERLLYALANHVGHIWATDLYTEGSLWPTARLVASERSRLCVACGRLASYRTHDFCDPYGATDRGTK